MGASCSSCGLPGRYRQGSRSKGKKRAKHQPGTSINPDYFLVDVEEIAGESVRARPRSRPSFGASIRRSSSYVKLNKKIPPETVMSVASIDRCRLASADTIVAHLGMKLEETAGSSSRDDSIPAERLEKVLGYMRSEIEILEVEKRIRTPASRNKWRRRKKSTT